MKTIVEGSMQSSALAQWQGADAKIWLFHITHKRLALRLARAGEPEVLYVVATGCEHINGPFSWKHADISLMDHAATDSGNPMCRIVDEHAAFALICSSATLVRGPATELDSTFENFLGDGPRD